MQYYMNSYRTGPGSWHSPELEQAGRNRAAWQFARQMGKTSLPYMRGRNTPRQAPAQRSNATAPAWPARQGTPNKTVGSLEELIAEYTKAHDKANEANQSRYEAIRGGTDDTQAAMGGYKGRYDKAMDMANLAADQRYREASAASNQDLISRGLRASTEATKGAFDAYERSQEIPLQTHMQASGDQLRFMERKNEPGPSMDQLVNLSMMAGAQNANSQIPNQLAMIRQAMGNGGGFSGFPQFRQQPFMAGIQYSDFGYAPFGTNGGRGQGQFRGQRRGVQMQQPLPAQRPRNLDDVLAAGEKLGDKFALPEGLGDDPAKAFGGRENDIATKFGKQLTQKEVDHYRELGVPVLSNPNGPGVNLKKGDYYIDSINFRVNRYG